MHGAGNDFVVLDLRDGGAAARLLASDGAALCRLLADRHRGVGCDQILTIEAPRSGEAIASYRIWNADGSASGQCGNGARCVAAWLVRDHGATGGREVLERFALDSPGATHAVERLQDGQFRIAMGVPEFDPARVPLHGVAQARDSYRLDLDGQQVGFGAVSIGNPHAVIEVDDVDAAPVAALGARLQRDAAFPESVNVGFAQVLAPDHVRLRVYERGAGETLACGSGACAAAAVLVRRGRIARDAVVSLPGGDLRIAWPRDDAPMLMAGPAAFVFEGQWSGELPTGQDPR